MKVTFPAAHLKAASFFAATQDIRYYLNGVLAEVRSTETRLVATNGHCAAVLRNHAAQDEMPDVIIPPLAIELALRLKSPVLELEFDGADWTLGGIPFKPVEGRYPDYRWIIPNGHSGKAAQFDTELVGRFRKAARALGQKSNPIIRHNGDGGAQVQIYGLDEIGRAHV